MFKFIVCTSQKEAVLIKKDNFLTEFWLRYAAKNYLAKKQSSHKSFNDKSDVLQYILNSELNRFTLLKSIDRKRKEYTQTYINNKEDLIPDKNLHKSFKKIIDEFRRKGLESYDHDFDNFIQVNNEIFLIDLDSFEFIENNKNAK